MSDLLEPLDLRRASRDRPARPGVGFDRRVEVVDDRREERLGDRVKLAQRGRRRVGEPDVELDVLEEGQGRRHRDPRAVQGTVRRPQLWHDAHRAQNRPGRAARRKVCAISIARTATGVEGTAIAIPDPHANRVRSRQPPRCCCLVGCAGHELVRADDMSATQHRLEAQRENEAAAKAAGAGPAAPAADPGGYDWNAERRRDAEAGASTRASTRPRPSSSSSSKIGSAGTSRLRAGRPARCSALSFGSTTCRAEFAPRLPTRDAFRPSIAEMRCHYAYARSRHFDEAIGCPLYVQGVEIRQALDPRAIEIVSRDEKIGRSDSRARPAAGGLRPPGEALTLRRPRARATATRSRRAWGGNRPRRSGRRRSCARRCKR